ncbi:DUF2252 domain-containing protein [Histidinibacterium aquaticum]|uniref:DUF2252 domain-containing protein n=1 Tax=Histidinibacterium aquaticum TaxID=2613962 RepID=A0A5J5GBF1_9RHOB|nr:DUF2252 family protein [Histidinibacterium aquaticum]KAA9005270.1 DUF2252 domain-containing protein [Histidinibacterium aquaticum]
MTQGKTTTRKTDNRSRGGRAKTESGSSKKEESPEIKTVRKAQGRVEAFRELSTRISAGEAVTLPVQLTGQARREHVRSTLREDHATRIEEQSSGAKDKFDELSGNFFKFFRGTALLFYRDMVGQDASMPTVMALGDVHPTNFGVMPDKNGAPIFGVNDFDEVVYAPFTWDLKRGATGFWIAAREEGELSRKKRRKVVTKFVQGYLAAMENYAKNATEKNDAYRMDNSPKVIRRLFQEAWEDREEWLWDDYLKPSGEGFRPNDELQPLSDEIETFQKAVNTLARRKGFSKPDRAGELRVKDVCVRHGQGTASLGLPRYYVLIEGPSKNATDDIIIEFKRARRSALEGLTPPTEFTAGDKADRIVHGQRVQLAHGDIFYGAVEIDGDSFMSRERAPFRDDIDLDDLSYSTWKDYAEVCGAALAQSHALSDDLGKIDYDLEPSIVEAARPRKLFVNDIMRFAEEAADRLKADHKLFCEDHADGAFDTIDKVYR